MDAVLWVLKKMRPKSRKPCQAFVVGSQRQCKNQELFWGTRYCWHHEAKLYVILAGILSVGSPLVSFFWNRMFPSEEATALRILVAAESKAPSMQFLVSKELESGQVSYELIRSNSFLFVPLYRGATSTTVQFALQNIGAASAEVAEVNFFAPTGQQVVLAKAWRDNSSHSIQIGMSNWVCRTVRPMFPSQLISLPEVAFTIPPHTTMESGCALRVQTATTPRRTATFSLVFFPSLTNMPPFTGTNFTDYKPFESVTP